jgi:phosphatidylserine/phosphatidylglycerophosphate/cardiolipin synthase-like enzyme
LGWIVVKTTETSAVARAGGASTDPSVTIKEREKLLQVSSPIYTDGKVSDAVLDLVEQAQHEVVLVSPYNKFWDHLRDKLQIAINRGVQITAIYRTDDEKSRTDIDWLGSKGATVYAVEKLHAKIYLSDSTVIVTSMNLLESSSKNSKELAVRIDDENSKKEIRIYTQRLKELGHLEYPKSLGLKQTDPSPKTEVLQPLKSNGRRHDPLPNSVVKVWNIVKRAVTSGKCIRCGEQIQSDPDKPFCNSCYKAWSRYKRSDYGEKYCHQCGKESATTQAKPRCPACYKLSK